MQPLFYRLTLNVDPHKEGRLLGSIDTWVTTTAVNPLRQDEDNWHPCHHQEQITQYTDAGKYSKASDIYNVVDIVGKECRCSRETCDRNGNCGMT